MVWRIPRRGEGKAYLALLLEFQCISDHWMSLRAVIHAGLLRQ